MEFDFEFVSHVLQFPCELLFNMVSVGVLSVVFDVVYFNVCIYLNSIVV